MKSLAIIILLCVSGDGAAMVTSAINNCSNVTMGLKMRSCFNDDYYEPEPELVLDAFPPGK